MSVSSTYAWPSFAVDQEKMLADEREAGRQAGFEQGHQQGIDQAEAEIAALRANLQTGLKDLDQARHDLDEQDKARLVLLLAVLVARLLRVELASNPDVVQHLVNEALVEFGNDATSVDVFANPDDLQRLGDVGNITVKEDAAVPPGGLSIRSSTRSVDYDFRHNLVELVDRVWHEDEQGADD